MENLAYAYTTEDENYEIIEGEKFMAPSANAEHNSVVGNLFFMFNAYFKKNKFGRVFTDNLDVHFPDGALLMPDVKVVCNPGIIKRGGTIYGVPDLVVEILSRSTMVRDFGIKRDIYERNGVKEYWIVNPWDKSVQVYHLRDDKLVLDNIYQVYSDDDLAELTEEEREAIDYQIKVSIFDDLFIDVHDIFEWLD